MKPPSTKRLRLCIVTPAHWDAAMGGAQYQIKCLLEALIPLKRYDIYFLARRVSEKSQPDGYKIVKIGRKSGVPRIFGFLEDAVPLYRALCEIGPDVIYQRVGGGYTGVTAYYARRHGARLIWHVAHDNDVMPGTQLEGNNWLRRFLEKRSIEYGLRHARHIVVQSVDQARLLKDNYGRAADAVIPNFHPEATEPIDKSGPVVVVWIANLKPWKQPEVFIRLADRLHDLADVRFVIVGRSPPGTKMRPWHDSVLQQARAAGNVEVLGEKTLDEVNTLLARAHVLVNTSLHEGFPNTFIQAWMRDVVVVSLSVDPDDMFQREGVGIHADTEERLAGAVRNLICDAQSRAAYAFRAQRHVQQKHSVRNAMELAQLIDTGEIRAHAETAVRQ